jgi:regulator of sigma E protease
MDTDILTLIADYAPAAAAIAVVFSVLVFVHEWGHYAAARACGVRVEAFSIGFGPELFGWGDAHGTRWKVCALPLGGYVQMFGDADPAGAGKDAAIPPGQAHEAFYNKPLWRRAVVVAAGPLINYAFALVLLAGLYMIAGQPVMPPVAAGVMVGSAADAAGMEPGDEVVSIGGRPVRAFGDIQRAMLLSRGGEVEVVVARDGAPVPLTAAPRVETSEDHLGFASSIARLGVMGPAPLAMDTLTTPREALCAGLDGQVTIEDAAHPTGVRVHLRATDNPDCATAEVLHVAPPWTLEPVRLGPLEAVGAAGARVWEVNGAILTSLGQIVTGARPATELGGVVRIGAVIGDSAGQGIAALVALAAFLSVTLGLINLFPVPMLDGGHLLFYAIEALRGGRPVPERVQDWAFQAGFVFLVGVMLFANLNDIVQLVW